MTTLRFLTSTLASKAGLDRGLFSPALGRAADVEGPHRQLGAGLADRLRGDDADGLPDIDDGAAREIAAIATCRTPRYGFFARQDRADRHRIDTGRLRFASTASSSHQGRRRAAQPRRPRGSSTVDPRAQRPMIRSASGEMISARHRQRRGQKSAVCRINLGDDRILRRHRTSRRSG